MKFCTDTFETKGLEWTLLRTKYYQTLQMKPSKQESIESAFFTRDFQTDQFLREFYFYDGSSEKNSWFVNEDAYEWNGTVE